MSLSGAPPARIRSLIKNVPLFKNLGSRGMAALARETRMLDAFPGQTIFAHGDRGRSLFVILKGRVKISSPPHGRKRKTYSYLKAGDFFGEMTLLDHKTRSASATALEPSSFLVVGKALFERLLASSPRLGRRLLEVLSARLRAADQEIETLIFGKLLNRLGRLLLFAKSAPAPRDLAEMLGTSREPLSRALGVLRRSGVAENAGGRVIVKDRARLRKFCLEL